MTPALIGLGSFVAILLLMALNLPIYATFMLVGFVGLSFLSGTGGALGLFASMPYSWATHYTLATIPFFLLMGHLVNQSGISTELFDSAQKWLGKLHGGLGIATTAACTVFAGCTGSSVAAAATMGAVTIPEMVKNGYKKSLAAGVVAAGGTLGILIPPSTHFIIYGTITETSIGRLFISGILPGLMLSAMFMLYIYVRVRISPELAPLVEVNYTWDEKFRSLTTVLAPIVLFIVVIGGLYAGFFVASEAGAIGAAGALIIALVRRRLKRTGLVYSLLETGRSTAMIFAIIIGAMIFNNLMALSGLPDIISKWVAGLPLSRYGILIAIIIIYIPLGMFMDTLAMTVLTLPIFFPVVTKVLGFDPVWFGTIHVLIASMALITPPVGLNVYVLSGVVKDITMREIFSGVWPFVWLILAASLILIIFPQIALVLPNMMMGK